MSLPKHAPHRLLLRCFKKWQKGLVNMVDEAACSALFSLFSFCKVLCGTCGWKLSCNIIEPFLLTNAGCRHFNICHIPSIYFPTVLVWLKFKKLQWIRSAETTKQSPWYSLGTILRLGSTEELRHGPVTELNGDICRITSTLLFIVRYNVAEKHLVLLGDRLSASILWFSFNLCIHLSRSFDLPICVTGYLSGWRQVITFPTIKLLCVDLMPPKPPLCYSFQNDFLAPRYFLDWRHHRDILEPSFTLPLPHTAVMFRAFCGTLLRNWTYKSKFDKYHLFTPVI